jgi:hypothetical protein
VAPSAFPAVASARRPRLRPSAVGPGGASEERRGVRWDLAATTAGAVLFVTAVGWQAVAGRPSVWNDTLVYRRVAVQPLTSSAFWSGSRPPLVPLVMKVVGSATGFVAAQAVVSVVAWGLLAWAVGRTVPAGWRQATAVLVVLGFATTLPVLLWNRSVLSESLSLSGVAVLVASLLGAAERCTWPRLGAVAVVALGVAAARDAQIWTVGFLALAIGAAASVRGVRHRPGAGRLGALALALVAVVVVTSGGAAAGQRTRQGVTDVLEVRIFPFPDRVAWFADHGMPEARAIDRVAAETAAPPAGAAKVVAVPAHDPAFRRLDQWLSTGATATYARWLVTHPGYVVSEPLVRPERTFNSAGGDLAFYGPTQDRVPSPLTPLLWPSAAWLILLAGAAALLAVWRGAWRSPPWRVAAALAVIGGLTMVVAWHGDGQEVTRHTVEGFAQLRLGLWLLVLFGALRPAEPTRRRRKALPVDRREDQATREASLSSTIPQPTPT